MSVTSCLLVILSSISAAALEPNLDFNITDEASYQSFKDAISKTEYVRNAYIQDPKPRVIGAVAGLVHYATFNPLASDTQLATFLTDYDAKLAAHALGDADLQRGSHLVSAVRFELPLSGVLALDGTNTTLGQEIVDFLGIDIPRPFNFESNDRRIVRFEQARLRALSESPAWANALTVGFSGQDLLGDPNPNLAGVLQTYLEGEGYSPLAPCLGCTDIGGDVLAALPVNYGAYQALLADPFAAGGIVDNISAGYEAVNQESMDRIDELTVIMMNEPSLVQAAANANNAAFVIQREAAYLANLAKVDDERAIINVHAMLLAQSPDESTREFGENAQRFASIQISQNKGWASAGEGVQILGGAASFAIEFLKGKERDPVALVGGAVDLVTGALGIGSLFGGGEEDDAAEQKIIDQMIAMREQLAGVQIQLNGRFNRIETQINVVYDALLIGFSNLGDGIDFLNEGVTDLQVNLTNANASLADLERAMAVTHASLDRIEDALWTIGNEILQNDLALIMNDVLDYRAMNSADLSYQNATPNFVTGLSNLSAFATDTAVNDTYAGADISTMTVSSAASDLNDPSIGRQINDLRAFPTMLGQPALLNAKVPAPSLWAQSASAYAQVARENPWYFAFKYKSELNNYINNNMMCCAPNLHNIIDKGKDLDALASSARNQNLFDALFDAWRTELQPVTSVIKEEILDIAFLGSPDMPGFPSGAVEISGDLAFVTDFTGLQVIDISDPTAFSIVGALNVQGSSSAGVAINGDLAFATGGLGFHVIDISDPTLPIIIGNEDTPGAADGVAISGALAVVTDAHSPSGVRVIDISDPAMPSIIGSIDTPGQTLSSVAISGDLAFVTDFTGLLVIDISDPALPSIIGTLDTPGSARDVAISGDLAIVADGPSGLQVVDISDPMLPSIIGSFDTFTAIDVAISGDLAFVADFIGLKVIDISDPVAPSIITIGISIDPTPPPPGGSATSVAIGGDLVFLPGDRKLFNISKQGGNLALAWQDVLTELDTNPLLQTTQTNLQGYQNLIESYITLGMPELMEESPIVRAALRSDATVGELAVGPVDDIVFGRIGNPDATFSTWWQVQANLQLLQDEVNAVLANPSVGHGYVDYMLAELEHLKDNAFKLALDDAYFTSFGETLIVPTGAGLLANDVDQQFRNIQVDLLFDQEPEYVAPQNGSLSLLADGSFDYTPDPGFGGTDSFTYRTFTDVGSLMLNVYSDPATVVVDVGITVANTDDSGPGSLRDTIANAPAGEVIRFDAALDGQPILLASQLNLMQDVTIDASTLPSGLTLDGGGITRVLHVDSGVVATLTGLTITGGMGGNGGGIENTGGILNLVDVSLIANNSAFYGGGIINFGGIVTATNTTIADNVAGFGGGGLYNGNSVASVFTLINSTIEGNTGETAGGGGGGIRNYLGAVNLIHTTIVGNDSPGNSGGGILNGGGTLSVENSIIAGNTAFAGSADFFSSTPVLTTGQNLIGDNESVAGAFPAGAFAGTTLIPLLPGLGALADNGGPTQTMLPLFGSPAIDSATDEALTPATDQRGQPRPGLLNDIGAVEVPALYGFITTAADDGSEGSLRAILAAAPPGYEVPFDAASLNGQPFVLDGALGPLSLIQDVTISGAGLPGGLTIDGNNATRVFLINAGATVSLEMLTITGGATPGNGAGIYNLGTTLDLVDVALVGNNAGGFGGGIMNFEGTVTMTNTTVANNNADLGGGGLFSGSSAAAVVTLINSTVYGNTGGGAGIGNYLGAVMNLIHTTVVGNDSTANPGGGIWNGGGTLNIENSIVAQNTAIPGSDDIFSDTTILSTGQNLIGDNESVAGAFPAGAFAGTTLSPLLPGLGAFADNGGPNQTMLPLIGSPAIDAAVHEVTSPPTDQRGTLRPQGLSDDIGSVEFVPEPAAAMGMISGVLLLAFLARRREQATRFTF